MSTICESWTSRASRRSGSRLASISDSDRRILDVGCGAGRTSIASDPRTDVISCGVDTDLRALALGRELTDKVRFICGTGESLPLRSHTFDLLTCRVALPYMDIPRALAEFERVLGRGGRLRLALHPPSMAINL